MIVSNLKCAELKAKAKTGQLNDGDKKLILSVVDHVMEPDSKASEAERHLVMRDGLDLVGQSFDCDGPYLELRNNWMILYDSTEQEQLC